MARYSIPIPDPVELVCEQCRRRWRLSREKFLRIAGTDAAPEARLKFAEAKGCEKAAHFDLIWPERFCRIKYVLTKSS